MKYMKYTTILLAIILTVGLMVGCAQKPPTITKVDPAMASAAGGTEITITGTGFKAAPVPTVTIGGTPATGVKVTKTTLKATVPAGVPGTADIVVQNSKAKVKSLPSKLFSYYEDVTAVTSIPDMASAPPEGIDAPAKIDVTFNQDLDPASAVVIKVMDATGVEVVGTVAPDAADPKMHSWTPSAPIKAGDYTLTVSGAKGTVAPAMAEMPVPFKVKEAVAAKPAKKGKK
jgi:hypothetical protein